MNDHQHAIDIEASADDVFAYVSDVGNMPSYLPTTQRVESLGKDRIHVEGEARGHRYKADGYLRCDTAKRFMEWGSDGDRKYHGQLEVRDVGPGRSNVTVRIHFDLHDQERAEMEQQPGGVDAVLSRGIQASLESIRNQCEGKGGKVEPPEATGG